MDETSERYQPISKLSLAALAVALIGLLSLILSSLVAVPVLGVVLATLAVRRVQQSGGRLAGGRIAAVALTLAGFTVACWAGRALLHRSLLIETAREHARQWLELVEQERLFEAHQLMKPEISRQAEGSDLYYHYRVISPEVLSAMNPLGEVYPLNDLEVAFNKSPLKEVAAALKAGDSVEFVRVLGPFYFQHYQVVNLVCRLQQDGRTFVMSMKRERDRVNRETSWQTLAVADVPEDERVAGELVK